MNTAERIDILHRHGLPASVVAATLGVEHSAVTDFFADPSNVPSLPSGGSSFAHLTEDDVDHALLADYNLVVAFDPDTYESDGGVTGTEIGRSGYIAFHTASSANPGEQIIAISPLGEWARFTVNGDGAVHWGDGTAAPGASLFYIDDPFPDSTSEALGFATARLAIAETKEEINNYWSGEGPWTQVMTIGPQGIFASNEDASQVMSLAYQFLHIQETADRILHLHMDTDGDPAINGQKIAFQT